jgi:hypothetical protein
MDVDTPSGRDGHTLQGGGVMGSTFLGGGPVPSIRLYLGQNISESRDVPVAVAQLACLGEYAGCGLGGG